MCERERDVLYMFVGAFILSPWATRVHVIGDFEPDRGECRIASCAQLLLWLNDQRTGWQTSLMSFCSRRGHTPKPGPSLFLGPLCCWMEEVRSLTYGGCLQRERTSEALLIVEEHCRFVSEFVSFEVLSMDDAIH